MHGQLESISGSVVKMRHRSDPKRVLFRRGEERRAGHLLHDVPQASSAGPTRIPLATEDQNRRVVDRQQAVLGGEAGGVLIEQAGFLAKDLGKMVGVERLEDHMRGQPAGELRQDAQRLEVFWLDLLPDRLFMQASGVQPLL